MKNNNILNQWPSRLEKIKNFFICPFCQEDLIEKKEGLYCKRCEKDYPLKNGKIYFTSPLIIDDALDIIKNRLKKNLGKYYYLIGVTFLAPSFPFNYTREIRQHINPECFLVIDIGCGNHRVDDHIITLDAIDYEAVDIVADVCSLPFKDNSIDAVCTRYLLEHLPDVNKAINGIIRCTKKRGLGIHLTPFIYPYHASPHDYTRWTSMGVSNLFNDWTLVKQINTTGPFSLFILLFIEFISIILSFGNERIKGILFLLLPPFLSPLKFFDIFFIGNKQFLRLAVHILTVIRKT